MNRTLFIALAVALLALGIIAGHWHGARRVRAMADTAARNIHSKALTDSLHSAHIIDSLNRIIAQQHIHQDSLAHQDSLINANPKYRAHAYRDSTTLSKLRFITGTDRRY